MGVEVKDVWRKGGNAAVLVLGREIASWLVAALVDHDVPAIDGQITKKVEELKAVELEVGMEGGDVVARGEGVEIRIGKLEPLEKSLRSEVIVKIGGEEVWYCLYIDKKGLMLVFVTTNRENAEKAAQILRALGHKAEAKKSGDNYRVRIFTEDLRSGLLKDTVLKLLEEHEDFILGSRIIDRDKLEWMRKTLRGEPHGGREAADAELKVGGDEAPPIVEIPEELLKDAIKVAVGDVELTVVAVPDDQKRQITLLGIAERGGRKVVAYKREIGVRSGEIRGHVVYGGSDKDAVDRTLGSMGVEVTSRNVANPISALEVLLSYLSEKEVNDILNDKGMPSLIREKIREMLDKREIEWKSEAEKRGVAVKADIKDSFLVFTVRKGDVEAEVKFGEISTIRSSITFRSDPPSDVDTSVWGRYDKDLDREILTAIFKAVGIEKAVGNKQQADLTKGDLEKLGRRFKRVDEALERWPGKRPAAQGST